MNHSLIGRQRLELEDALAGSTTEQGWSNDSVISVLLDFLNEECNSDPLVPERFQRFLDNRVEEENQQT